MFKYQTNFTRKVAVPNLNRITHQKITIKDCCPQSNDQLSLEPTINILI